jgi:hypothetical protein
MRHRVGVRFARSTSILLPQTPPPRSLDMVDSPSIAGLIPLASGTLSFNACRDGAGLTAINLASVTPAAEHGALATPGTQKHAADRFHTEPPLHRRLSASDGRWQLTGTLAKNDTSPANSGGFTPAPTARDRSGATADFLLEAVSKKCLSEALSPRVKADAILCTDGSAAMAAAAKEMGVHHEAMNLSAGERVRGPWHIQNANAYHGRLKGWMHRFKGVATSYLESYLGWFRALDRATRSRAPFPPMLRLALGLEG